MLCPCLKSTHILNNVGEEVEEMKRVTNSGIFRGDELKMCEHRVISLDLDEFQVTLCYVCSKVLQLTAVTELR